MSKLQELIDQLCPNGVPFRTVRELVGVNRGKRLTKSELSDDYEFEVYHGSKDTPLGRYNLSNAPARTTIVVNTGGIGGVKYLDKPFWCSDGSFWLGHSELINDKYLYYCLSGCEDYFFSKKRVGGVPTIDKTVIEDFKIPVPPLEVQDEIVRILDNFTELTARQKQYKYYLDSLFASIDGRYSRKLGDFAVVRRGGNFQKKDFVDEGLPCIHYGQMYTHYGVHSDRAITFVSPDVFYASKLAHPGDIVMAVTSENVDDVCKCVAWLGKTDIAISGHTAIISHNQNPKFLSYFFHSETFYRQKTKYAHGTKVIEVTPSKLVDIIVPVPTLEEQERIVSMLDRLNSLCNDISNGLPAEIAARQKQYEYYRDKLLTFKELKA